MTTPIRAFLMTVFPFSVCSELAHPITIKKPPNTTIRVANMAIKTVRKGIKPIR